MSLRAKPPARLNFLTVLDLNVIVGRRYSFRAACVLRAWLSNQPGGTEGTKRRYVEACDAYCPLACR
jgi:hypothetical protein